jgi:hypothetical protein
MPDNGSPITTAECLTLMLFGCALSMALLRFGMTLYGDHYVYASTIEGTIVFWTIAYAVMATYAFMKGRRS